MYEDFAKSFYAHQSLADVPMNPTTEFGIQNALAIANQNLRKAENNPLNIGGRVPQADETPWDPQAREDVLDPQGTPELMPTGTQAPPTTEGAGVGEMMAPAPGQNFDREPWGEEQVQIDEDQRQASPSTGPQPGPTSPELSNFRRSMGADRLTASVHELYKMAPVAAAAVPAAEAAIGAEAAGATRAAGMAGAEGAAVGGALSPEALAGMGPELPGMPGSEGGEQEQQQPQQQQQGGDPLQAITSMAQNAGGGVGSPSQNYGA